MDPIANMITSIRNAGNAGLSNVSVPHSKIKESIADILMKEGFIKSFDTKTAKGKPVLHIELFIDENRTPKIRGIKRISKPSKRVYKGFAEIRPVLNGYGTLVLSTPQGVMSARDAKKNKVGGEALFSIW